MSFEQIVFLGIVCVAVFFLHERSVARKALQNDKAREERVKGWRKEKRHLRSGQASDAEWEAWIAKGEELESEVDAVARVWRQARKKHDSAPTKWCTVAQSIRDDMNAYGAAKAGASTSSSPSVLELARLRSSGMISDDEFKAFSERFELSTGEKAQEIIKAIEDLHEQHRSGAMTQGNYHASLWTLMDKIDQAT